MKYRLKHDNETIKAIMDAFETCITGIGFTILCDVTLEEGERDSTIVLETKDPEKELNLNEILTFGMIIGRDYLTEECRTCASIQKLQDYKNSKNNGKEKT